MLTAILMILSVPASALFTWECFAALRRVDARAQAERQRRRLETWSERDTVAGVR